MIISNGMSKGDLLRINNQPDLVVVDVNRYDIRRRGVVRERR